MKSHLLILRPEPGAAKTATRAAGMGLKATVAPLFTVAALPWQPPDPSSFDAVLLTSANAARHAGKALASFTHLPCYAVGEATAEAAAAIGFPPVHTGPSDGAAAVAMMMAQGVRRALHLCGREHISFGAAWIEHIAVYAAEPVGALPTAACHALDQGAITLLHSPRAGQVFSHLVEEAGLARGDIALVAISGAAAAAAGTGWRIAAAAALPRDHALLELAAKLCQNGGTNGEAGG